MKKTNKKKYCLYALLILIIIICFGLFWFITNNTVAKLTNVTGGSFVESAGYYEGELKLKNIKTDEEYSIFACSKSWSWVREGSCYEFSPSKVEDNVESHKESLEISGCYVGTLEQVSCD